jgi:hypothetical protein
MTEKCPRTTRRVLRSRRTVKDTPARIRESMCNRICFSGLIKCAQRVNALLKRQCTGRYLQAIPISALPSTNSVCTYCIIACCKDTRSCSDNRSGLRGDTLSVQLDICLSTISPVSKHVVYHLKAIYAQFIGKLLFAISSDRIHAGSSSSLQVQCKTCLMNRQDVSHCRS